MSRVIASVGLAGVLLAVCGTSCNSGGGGSGTAGETCPVGFDGGTLQGGTLAASSNGQCANQLTGTQQNGGACQESSDCAPACCACPGSDRTAQVAWCNQGTCEVGPEACCAWIENASGADGGPPFVCQK
jgi:hypothetical protein